MPKANDDAPSSPVRIEVGASAKAEFRAEIKGEIPSQSLGRTLDSLIDIIRPFTERRGLAADQVRLQRADVLVEIAKRAKEQLQLEGREPAPVPNKTLVPLLEKASLEEITDEDMIIRWSSLLASASTQDVPPRLVSVLGELSAYDANLLEQIFFGRPVRTVRENHPAIAKVNAIRRPFNAVVQSLDRAVIEDDLKRLVEHGPEVSNEFQVYAAILFSGRGTFHKRSGISYQDYVPEQPLYKISGNQQHLVSESVLESLNLVSREKFSTKYRNHSVEFEFLQITALGVALLTACSKAVRDEVATMTSEANSRR